MLLFATAKKRSLGENRKSFSSPDLVSTVLHELTFVRSQITICPPRVPAASQRPDELTATFAMALLPAWGGINRMLMPNRPISSATIASGQRMDFKKD